MENKYQEKEVNLTIALEILEKENRLLKGNIQQLSQDLNGILNSKSYKIAHKCSSLIRKILGKK
jgi:vacuolar-type H+-ATPase subunit E/Vma4